MLFYRINSLIFAVNFYFTVSILSKAKVTSLVDGLMPFAKSRKPRVVYAILVEENPGLCPGLFIGKDKSFKGLPVQNLGITSPWDLGITSPDSLHEMKKTFL